MRQRAISVDLEPRIEEPCMSDLGALCSGDVAKGEVSVQNDYDTVCGIENLLRSCLSASVM